MGGAPLAEWPGGSTAVLNSGKLPGGRLRIWDKVVGEVYFQGPPLDSHPPFKSPQTCSCQKPDVLPVGPKETGLADANSDCVLQSCVLGVPSICCLFVRWAGW